MSRSPLHAFLTDAQRREIEDVRSAAAHILAQPLDHTFTDHTIAHPDRILEHLDVLLSDWAEREVREDPDRTRAEIFILLAAVYLHDIGMQFQLFDQCPSVEAHLPTLAEALRKDGHLREPGDHPFTPETLAFARKHHHLLTYDWITHANLRTHLELLPFEDTGLRSYVDHVARVAWSHNVWLTNEKSYEGYERELANAQEQEGEIRISLLAAFLRLGDLLDLDHRRVDVNRLRRFEIPPSSKAHWWRHHFIRTSRLDERRTDRGRRLHLVFTVPRQHEEELAWIRPALCAATVAQVQEEQDRLRRWLAPVGVWIDLPPAEACQVKPDVSGRVLPMPADTVEVFRRTWRGAEAESARVEIKNALEEGKLSADKHGEHIRTLGIQVEIEDYLRQVESQYEQGFRDTPYTPIELDYGEFHDALDALEALLREPDPIPRPIVVLGEPGGGKTTLVRRYVLDCARRERTPTHLPLYLQANRYGDTAWAEEIERRLGTAQSPATPEEQRAVKAELVERLLLLMAESLCDLAKVSYRHREAMLRYLLDVMARTSCLIVIDGLNEVPPLRRWLAINAVESFVKEYRQHRVVITSREGDYHEDYFRSSREHRVKPLRDAAIRSYWDAIGVSRAVQDRTLSSGPREVAELVRNPMYMFMAGELLKGGNSEAIGDPGQLFQRFTGESLRRWHRGDARTVLQPEEMRDLLAEVAYHALQAQEVSFEQGPIENGITAWRGRLTSERRSELEAALARAEPPMGGRSAAVSTTDGLIERMLATGFLQRQGQAEARRFAFRHHTTQDYFAAVSIAGKVERLHEVVSRPVFHEALRMVPGIIEDPNAFLRRLTASTSEQFGRASLLALSFRVAGPVRGKLEPDVVRQLFAGAIPLLQAVAGLYLPFAVEVLGYLFHHVGWQELGRFLAQAAENPALPPTTRSFASQRLAKVMVRDDAPAAGAIAEILGDAIPPGMWSDYRQCKAVIEHKSSGENRLHTFPLLSGAVGSTISLSVEEKLRIARVLGQITPNQLGALQMIFLEEITTWGALSMLGDCDAVLLMLQQETLTNLLLLEEDSLLLQGRTREAIAAYLAACSRVGVKHPLLERLVLLSAHMSPEEVEQLRGILRGYEGEAHGRMLFLQSEDYATALYALRRTPEIHASIREMLVALPWSANPWLLLWRESILRLPVSSAQRTVTPEDLQCPEQLAAYLEDIAARMEWSQPAGQIFLESMGQFVPGHDVRIKVLLERYYPERPARKFEQLKELIQTLPRGEVAAELTRQMVNVGFSAGPFAKIFSFALEAFEPDVLLPFVEGLCDVDRDVQRTAKICFLAKLAEANAGDELRRAMDRWGLDVDAIAKDTGPSCERILRALYYSGEQVVVLQALGRKRRYLALRLREETGDLEGATWTALLGLEEAVADGKSPVRFADAVESLARKQSSRTEASSDDILRMLSQRLLPLLGDPVNGDWAFKRLERLRKGRHVDLDAYAERIEEVLCSARARTTPEERTCMLHILSTTEHRGAVLRCLDAYAEACPRDPAKAAAYLGNGAWYAYLAGDDARFERLTDAALTLATLTPATDACRTDWLLGNRGLARLLRGATQEALEAYVATRQVVADRERWQAVALDDLEQHPARRPGASLLPPEIIEAVVRLGADLPVAPGGGVGSTAAAAVSGA
ncbi:hypothetical protein BE20_46915 [Sorangium cellulosum]|uniref:HD-CE domain-containing protein n=1 Tax=Sorangium cellulosum TaxID=56 RepID=A0A150SJI5_SORCE|nr:hypothetical protein BE18_21665 [Sorangium cellulosum]KYF95040.1 hypothetical protein BE20_46915 [Sorangium cellulosum]